jgi:CheY-like chemotaxis protein
MKQTIKTILLVEDDATNRKLVRVVLGTIIVIASWKR